MPTSPMSHKEVHEVCTNLETSPSCHSPGSSIYNPGEMEGPHAKKHSPKHAAGAKGHMTNKESGFGSGRNRAAKNVPKKP